jgi:hypothetical protein
MKFSLIPIINCAFKYVIRTSKLYNFDESHALKHSMDVYNFANKIYESEKELNPFLENQKEIIYVSAIIHDMCDKKYMSEIDGINMIKTYLSNYMSLQNIEVISNIVLTMSYSKVKLYGYPDIGEYQLAYHIVREADLLSSYDINRSIIYSMYKENNSDYDKALQSSIDLFDTRISKYIDNDLFITNYSKNKALILHKNAEIDVEILRKLLD